MVVDIGEVKRYIKPKADSTLNNMRKSDLIEYIRCLENNYNVSVSFNENQAKYIESLGVLPMWIPVTERLPDTQEYDWVLAQITMLPSCIYGVPVVAEWRPDGWYDAYDNLIDGKYEKVTHWMPLPEPPKEENHEPET